MKYLSLNKQIILITHQPQIAGYANGHYFVQKEVMNERTLVKIKDLTGESRIKEIARMLAGDRITETSIKHARELLELSTST